MFGQASRMENTLREGISESRTQLLGAVMGKSCASTHVSFVVFTRRRLLGLRMNIELYKVQVLGDFASWTYSRYACMHECIILLPGIIHHAYGKLKKCRTGSVETAQMRYVHHTSYVR